MCYGCKLCGKCGRADKLKDMRDSLSRCKKCGAEVHEGDVRCPECGKILPPPIMPVGKGA